MLPPYSSGHGEYVLLCLLLDTTSREVGGDAFPLSVFVMRRRYLFNLHTDPTESRDLSEVEPERFATMKSQLDSWAQSIKFSQSDESECLPKTPVSSKQSNAGLSIPAFLTILALFSSFDALKSRVTLPLPIKSSSLGSFLPV